MCTRESHQALKQDRARYVEATDFLAWQPDMELPALEVRNCKACHSTLADGTRREEEVAHAA
jgi:RNase P subunit RPR2